MFILPVASTKTSVQATGWRSVIHQVSSAVCLGISRWNVWKSEYPCKSCYEGAVWRNRNESEWCLHWYIHLWLWLTAFSKYVCIFRRKPWVGNFIRHEEAWWCFLSPLTTSASCFIIHFSKLIFGPLKYCWFKCNVFFDRIVQIKSGLWKERVICYSVLTTKRKHCCATNFTFVTFSWQILLAKQFYPQVRLLW